MYVICLLYLIKLHKGVTLYMCHNKQMAIIINVSIILVMCDIIYFYNLFFYQIVIGYQQMICPLLSLWKLRVLVIVIFLVTDSIFDTACVWKHDVIITGISITVLSFCLPAQHYVKLTVTSRINWYLSGRLNPEYFDIWIDLIASAILF